MPPDFEGRRVRVYRDGPYREVVLARPAVHNAVDVVMRDELVVVVRTLLADDEARTVGLIGEGPSFCSGGDLGEFGQATDPVRAHLQRTARSLPWLVAQLGPRLVAGVHGACFGAGVELAAFAGTVIAAVGTRFKLPEIGMGLVPGMGGTVSLPPRIGRQRALWMMVTGDEVTADRAREWGLVDRLVAPEELAERVRAEARDRVA